MAPPELAADIEAGNKRKAISEDTYERCLAGTFAALSARLGQPHAVSFDPLVHLKYYSQGPAEQHKYNHTRRITMEELGLTSKTQISPVGVSDPFPLFTDEAVDIMRWEILHRDTFLANARLSYNSTSGLDCAMRGYVSDGRTVHTPFTHAAWTHPETMQLISTMAGVDLQVVMDHEIAHVNVGITDPHTAARQRSLHEAEQRERLFRGTQKDADADAPGPAGDAEIPAIVGWHHDAYPFVCVLMLSDTTDMVGGETYLRMGDGQLARVAGPQKGHAAVLQGRLIRHLAPKPVGATERITMVTSYRARDAAQHDGSVLGTVKPEINYGSKYSDFYRQWVGYRAEVIKARLDRLTASMGHGTVFDKAAATAGLQDIEAYLAATYTEMEVTADEWREVVGRG
ncbi:hypothetical protein METBIDRAFT_77619 [Metschnikowia bicuspidata var. bicuspidata NRRL YB-4993]|uniref:Fe2OG dioxygenase domain-containing protein n=1 Tax=Metschnikowia bicuspidata var. bicuspidata NRRL YB-4993 TaxID=869754 RepID=A0A1A0HE18_9ASCO|nr:hypothetical protein METBIDRAFT_77619 [Metschnikowia bicuspidata var. bicuspidata NRRL YB-4993]OBA22148.1 hypothetical protein METBIDRAFT_77619 [Metschnikowia bicuspidata var. bicuspidata NRRL YB-4993]